MNGIHDMGGMDGFGAVDPVEAGAVFHEEWEGEVMATSRVMGAIGAWNIDQGRYGIEMLPPHLYLKSYYRRWLERFERALVNYGYADADEIAAGHALRPGKTPPRGKFTLADIDRINRRGTFTRPETAPRQVCRGRPGARAEHASRRRIPGCPAMSAAMWASWSGCMAVTSSRIPRLSAKAKTLSGSTLCGSMGAICGDRTPIRP